MRLLRQLATVMRQASAAGSFFDAWMKQQSDLVQGAAQAFAGAHNVTCMCLNHDYTFHSRWELCAYFHDILTAYAGVAFFVLHPCMSIRQV
jgi:hypothetical protein